MVEKPCRAPCRPRTELHRGRFHPLFPLFYPARLRTAAMGDSGDIRDHRTVIRIYPGAEKLRHYTLWVCWITLALVALTRIEMIFNPLEIKFQVFDNRETYAQLADTAQGRPIIFNGSYTAAAKYHFYTGGESYAQPVVTYRTSHYQLRDDDTRMAGRAVLTEVLDSTPGAQEIKLANGKEIPLPGRGSVYSGPENHRRNHRFAANSQPGRFAPPGCDPAQPLPLCLYPRKRYKRF